ncbi:unnamed protein product [Didymodactylos carnosus]|uniref:Uncharacterized protein n=1 Tax=Didymodactylos carnosus TaxID=1234261 RepID=A0A8S2DAJ0_9BILA|nr:unnamed protein product [Didymodactylos carnosus]CAF3693668.1 unnamed protein product [Didymodactylos carnosus]
MSLMINVLSYTPNSIIQRLNDISEDYYALASSGHSLLVECGLKLCLYDQRLNSTEILWNWGLISDICWCEQLHLFIIVTVVNVYIFDETKLIIDQIETIQPYKAEKKFWGCTCTDQDLFISYKGCDTRIDQYALTKSYYFIQQWKHLCSRRGIIRDMRCTLDKKQLCLLVSTENDWRLDVRNSGTMEFIWSRFLLINLDARCRLSMLPNSESLIINWNENRIFRINGNSTLVEKKDYKTNYLVRNIEVVGFAYLVVYTSTGLYIYEI